MTVQRTYLDYNATAPTRPESVAAVTDAMAVPRNASSVHGEGRASRRVVEDAREAVAGLVGARSADVVFVSGGTEANATGLAPVGEGVCLVGSTEHPSVLSGGRFPADRLETIPVDGCGRVDLDWIARRLRAGSPVDLISVMAANNETGVLQPVGDVATLARESGVRVHCDAVQAAGRTPLSFEVLGIDLMTLSAHKIGGPHGVGALVRRGPECRIVPLVRGGGQERGSRAGTENVPAIAGFGVAARLAQCDARENGRFARLRDWLEEGLRAISPDTVVFSESAQRLANTSCFAVPGVSAERAVIALDLDGIATSSGSACSSGKVGPSHVLAAMGVAPHVAEGAIRVSLGWASADEDIDRFLGAWRRIVPALKKAERGRAA